jgi:integrase
MQRLSSAAVRNAKPGWHADGGGLCLQVTSGKKDDKINKSWVFCYTLNKREREREMGLGSLNTIGLSQAREEAGRWRVILNEGRDPIEVRDAERAAHRQAAKPAPAAVSFERCSILYMAAHEAGWRNAKHRQQWNNTLATYAYPVIGALPVDAIDTNHVVQILMPIWTEKNETASRVRGRLVKILDWAHVQKYRTGENPARWAGHLEHLLAACSKVHKVENQPVLPWEQIPEFMRELRRQEGLAAKCLEFTILTAARSGESRGLPWDGEIADDVWLCRMKGDREHRVPLTAPALAIIDYMRDVLQNDYVFPGDDPEAPLSDMSLTAVIRRMNEAREKAGKPKWIDPKQGNREVVPHGFRSSFDDWVGEDTDFPDWLAEDACPPSAVQAVTMTDGSGPPGEGAKGRLALTPFETAWRKHNVAGKREPLSEAGLRERYDLNCERIWCASHWSVWDVLSWIAFRQKALLCNIRHKNSLSHVKCFDPKAIYLS